MGFKCAATDAGGKGNSHMSVMTAICDLCEQADPLNGTRKKLMHDHALSILTSAELEAEARFKAFLTSKNPAAPFPSPYLAEGSPIKTLPAKKFTQLKSILDLQGFDDSILNTGELTRTSTVHMHSQLCLSLLTPTLSASPLPTLVDAMEMHSCIPSLTATLQSVQPRPSVTLPTDSHYEGDPCYRIACLLSPATHLLVTALVSGFVISCIHQRKGCSAGF